MTNAAPSLANALLQLERAATAAALDPQTARAEGEALAAAVAESAKFAHLDWSRETGRQGTQLFFDAASRGRKWRSAPTTLLAQLVIDRSAQAPAYADALAAVSAAAVTLGEPASRIAGNAALASAAQRAAVRPPESSAPASRNPLPLLRSGGSSLDLTLAESILAGSLGGLNQLNDPPVNPERSSTGDPGSAPAATPEAPAVPAGPPEQSEPEPEPKTVAELLAELDALTGLTAVKAEIHRQVAVLRVEALRTKAGLASPTITRHLIFVGNPGTGKTTVARLVGGIYRALGLLTKGQLIEVDRSELVAGYLGQTAMKTAEVVASAVGGVLFIDEAYSLSGDQYGTEAVDTLVKEMEDKRNDLVLIVAGYPDPMAIFVAQNPGLASRFRTTIDFADYSDDELEAIFLSMAAGADYDVTKDCLQRFRMILAITPRGPTFGNGRFARNHLEAAIGRHAWRLRDIDEPTLQQLRELQASDLDDEVASDPETPGLVYPVAPETLGIAEESGAAEESRACQESGVPEESDSSEESDIPETLDVRETPDATETVDPNAKESS
jgi:hypothetical protein